MTITIAIDGPAAAGKGTISKAVAEHLGLAHLDTGLLYRAVAARTLAGEDAIAVAQDLSAGDLEVENLRTAEVAQMASKVAAIPEVRLALVAFQRDFARHSDGAVLDGRDIGTVICPDAAVKLFVTASPEVRARRRYQEQAAQGSTDSYETVLTEVLARDERDMNRADAPLKPADDAVLIDTSDLGIKAAVDAAIRVIEQRMTDGA